MAVAQVTEGKAWYKRAWQHKFLIQLSKDSLPSPIILHYTNKPLTSLRYTVYHMAANKDQPLTVIQSHQVMLCYMLNDSVVYSHLTFHKETSPPKHIFVLVSMYVFYNISSLPDHLTKN